MIVYGIHRIIGIRKSYAFQYDGRFAIIRQYKNHIVFYISLSIAGLIWSLSYLSIAYLIPLIIPGAISVLYVIPALPKNKRIRDYNYIKIILIALVWASLTINPYLSAGKSIGDILIMLLERICFLLSITIPFDIRDCDIDSEEGLSTIATKLGKRKSYWLAYCFLTLSAFLFLWHGLSMSITILIYLITGVLIYLSKEKKSDWYFGGLLDSSLIIRGLIIFYCSS